VAKTYEQFADDLKRSVDAVFIVAKWVHSRGYDIIIPAVKLRPRGEASEKYIDDGDFHFIKDGETKKVSVKCLHKTTFTDKFWPYKDVFVANRRFVDLKGDEISYYMTIDWTAEYVCVIDADKNRAINGF